LLNGQEDPENPVYLSEKKGLLRFSFSQSLSSRFQPTYSNGSVISLQILIGGDLRIIDGEEIQPIVRRPPVGSV
jgi:hypothetical protein